MPAFFISGTEKNAVRFVVHLPVLPYCAGAAALINSVKFHLRRIVDECIQPPPGQPRLTRLLPGKLLLSGFPTLLETPPNRAQTTSEA